jgi:hypothetical protein
MLFAVLFLAALIQPAPPGYEAAAGRVPERHWALVREARIDRESGGQARRATMSIHLTPYGATGRGDAQLVHEVGHLVYYADPALERDWRRWVGPRADRARASELFADAYESVVLGGCAEVGAHEHFLRARVFRPGEYPCRR